MGSLATSSVSFLRADGKPGSPSEWDLGFVALDLPPDDWQRLDLRVQGESRPVSLRTLDGGIRIVAEWPRSNAGNYELVLERDGEPVDRVVWTIAPKKISSDGLVALVDQLQRELPTSIVIALQRLGALGGLRVLPPSRSTVAQELLRLRRAVDGVDGGTSARPGLHRLLPLISRDPHVVLISADRWVPRERARRIHPASLPKIYARPHNLDDNLHPIRLPEIRVERTVDTYENRVIRAFYDEVSWRLRILLRTLSSKRDGPEALEAVRLGERVKRARQQATFLDDVGRLTSSPTRLSMVLLRRPEYRAAFEGYLELHRSNAVHLDEAALEAPLADTPFLYQTWGVLEAVRALLEVAADLGYTLDRQRLTRAHAGGMYVRLLRGNKPVVELSHPYGPRKVKLTPQRSYGRRLSEAYSISYPQIPDVALEIEEPERPDRVLILDPKYKLESEQLGDEAVNARPKKLDIDAMHAYRDAIRNAAGERIVEFAAILYPGPDVDYHPGLCAIKADPLELESLHDRLSVVFRTALKIDEPDQAAA